MRGRNAGSSCTLPEPNGVGFVMQMLSCEFGMDHALIGGIDTEIEYLRLPVIDPDDGVIVDSHDVSLWLA